MLSEADILTALRDCFDPEVKLNLVDLGLIYSIETGPDPDSAPAWPRQWVKVTMSLTTPQCPASGLIFEQVHNRLAGIPGISKVQVDLVWEPNGRPTASAKPDAGNWGSKSGATAQTRPSFSRWFETSSTVPCTWLRRYWTSSM